MTRTFWQGLGRKGQVGLIAGAACVVAAVAAAGFWLLRTDYQVLFAELTAQDAAAMTAELERLKIPYRLAEEGASAGSSILVDRHEVHRTRIKLMGKDIPLHGAVGLELFNNSDFGMTEFAQRVNYQRALQGELTRTILSLAEIRDARVLLALPEQGLFKQASSKPKASITLTLKREQTLRPEQIAGIQRLVSAAVPGIATQDVTIVDGSGVALTRATGETDREGGSGALDFKKETESYLSRKATAVLERAVGEGQALASVDVTLDMDRVQTTTEDVVPAPRGGERAPSGVVVRERETMREVNAPVNARAGNEGGAGALGGSSQREVEYAVGRRVEQVIGQPGSIRRIQVVAVVKHALDPAQAEGIRSLVAASVGASAERGDTVVVHSIAALAARESAGPPGAAPLERAAPEAADAAVAAREWRTSPPASTLGIAAAALAAAVAVAVLWTRRRRPAAHETAPMLSEAQRQATLAQVRAWVRADAGRPPRELS